MHAYKANGLTSFFKSTKFNNNLLVNDLVVNKLIY